MSLLRKPLTVDGVARMARPSKRMFELYHGKMVSLAVIEPSAADGASKEVREKSAEYPHKIVSTAAEGAGWLVPILAQVGVTQSAADMVAAVEAARAAIR